MESIKYERALEIKAYLDSIKDFLTSEMANKVWDLHLEVYNPEFREAPCGTCSPKPWVNMINNLKRDIGTIIDSHVEVPVQEDIIQTEAPLQTKTGGKAKK